MESPMALPHQILAADNELKIFVWVAVAIIWGLAHIASWIKKAASPPKPRATNIRKPPIKQAMPMRMASMPQGRPQPASMPRQVPLPARRIPVAKLVAPGRASRVMPPPLPGARLQPAPPPVPVARVAQPPRPAPAPELTPAPPTPARSAPATRSAGINRWLRPATLRRQFILTEIFQKPLAQRSEE
jgi:hypothetical protein